MVKTRRVRIEETIPSRQLLGNWCGDVCADAVATGLTAELPIGPFDAAIPDTILTSVNALK